jgi:hypothetical protein
VSFTAAAGEVNNVTARHVSGPGEDPGTWQITDATATLIAGGGCTQIDEHNASCPPFADGSLEGATFELGDEDDSLTTQADSTASGGNVLSASGDTGDDRFAIGTNWFVSVSGDDGHDDVSGEARRGVDVHSLFMNGGRGNDRLDGSQGPDFLDGGGGDDELFGRGGPDELTDGDRDNRDVDRRPGSDRLDGGTGDDSVSYAKRTAAVSVDLASGAPAGEAGENDIVVRVESVSGGRGDDRLAGNARTNYINGGRGADRIFGRGNWDSVDPGAGEDIVSCGPSSIDSVNDPRRTTLVARDCESVSVGGFRGLYAPYPKLIDRNRVTYELTCPGPVDDGLGPPSSCAGSARLSTASSPYRVLAAAPIPRGQWLYGQELQLGLPLTAVGRRLAARRRGVRAVVRIHFRDGPGRRDEPALFAWMIRLTLPR